MSDIEPGRSLAEQVFDRIREGIISGEFRPGEHHSVQTFADKLAAGSRAPLSRAPVREALVRLSEAGMVRFERNRGIQIVQPTVNDLKEIFQLRLMVEPPAAGRAATRTPDAVLETLVEQLHLQLRGMQNAITEDDFNAFMDHDVGFHDLVLEAAGSGRLRDLVRNLRDSTRTLGLDVLLREATDLDTIMRGHIPVLEALKARDPQTVAAVMYEHVADIGDLLMRQLASSQDEVDPNWTEGIAVPTYGGQPMSTDAR